MNLLHLKYAIEVEKTRSISKAAESLFMGQPNLSRAIKELEESLGITIFRRTSKGIIPTVRGEEFLAYAKSILAQVGEVEALYRKNHKYQQRFSISIPRASYIANAFTAMVGQLDSTAPMEIFFKETNSMRAITNVVSGEYSLGIIRYQSAFEQYFINVLAEKGLLMNDLCEFSYRVLMSREHPLADCDTITLAQLCEYIEIAHGDPYVPSMPLMDARRAELSEQIDKRIFVFERGSQFDLLCNVPNTYMWVSPVPQPMLERYGLVERICGEQDRKYRDALIYKEGYRFTRMDKMFLRELDAAKTLMEQALDAGGQ